MKVEEVLNFDGGFLRPLNTSEVHAGYISGLNDPDVNRYLDAVKHKKQTFESVSEFVATNEVSSNSVLWGIWREGFDIHCGTVRLHGIEHYHKTAHIGICIFDKSAWGQHLGKKAISAVTNWGFNKLDLRWIEAGAYAKNIASQKAFISAGYSWIYNIPGKYIFEGKATTVKVFAAIKSY